MSIYDFQLETIKGEQESAAAYKGKVALVVNTASKCGYTPQYADLQKLYEQYKDRGLNILAFPSNQFGGQEPGSNEEVEAFCQVNYGVTFPLFAKTDVKGEHAHPFFKHLIAAAPFSGFDTEDPAGQRMQAMFQDRMPQELENNEIKWNFTKFLIDREGNVVKRYESPVKPEQIAADIEKLL